MKTFIAVALILTTGLAALSLWGFAHARRMAGSTSQIFIHGAPVCITQRGGEIRAAVGECAVAGKAPGEAGDRLRGGRGFHGDVAPELPPGHPPVGPVPGTLFEENRAIRI